MNYITSGNQEPLPFTNFGETLIRLVTGTCLGTLEEYPKITPNSGSPKACNIFMSLADMI